MGDEDIMSKKKRRILIIAVTLAVLVAASVALYIYIDKEKRVYKEYVLREIKSPRLSSTEPPLTT